MTQNGLSGLPALIEDERTLEDVMTQPTDPLVRAMDSLEGDLMILGVGGKMGPSLARLAHRASQAANKKRCIIGVSRFSQQGLRQRLHQWGIETIACDLLDPEAVANLPEIANIIFMAGRKFGSTGAESLTWAMNVYLPGIIASRFPRSRIVVFSSGNVYPFSPVAYGGPTEQDEPAPVGEYAQSVLGRERIFEHFSTRNGTPVATIRLNYAIDLRYGVLLDVAQKVYHGQPLDLTMGHANVIWQGDANTYVLRSLALATSPPTVLNVTGPEVISLRWLARRFGEHFGKEPIIVGEESDTALLGNAARCFSLFGYPRVPLDLMVRWVAHWVKIGGPTLDKPTHFEVRDGRF